MRVVRYSIYAIIVAACIWLLIPWAKEFLAIDCCLDRGGRWNYETKECEYADPVTGTASVPTTDVD